MWDQLFETMATLRNCSPFKWAKSRPLFVYLRPILIIISIIQIKKSIDGVLGI